MCDWIALIENLIVAHRWTGLATDYYLYRGYPPKNRVRGEQRHSELSAQMAGDAPEHIGPGPRAWDGQHIRSIGSLGGKHAQRWHGAV